MQVQHSYKSSTNKLLNFTYSRSDAFRYERQNENPALIRIELTTSALASVRGYVLDHSGDEGLHRVERNTTNFARWAMAASSRRLVGIINHQ